MVVYVEEKEGKQVLFSMGQPLPVENIKKLEGMTIKHIQFLDHKAMFTLK